MGRIKLAMGFLFAAVALAKDPGMLVTDCVNVQLEGTTVLPFDILQTSQRTIEWIYRDIGISVRFSVAATHRSDGECAAIDLLFVADVSDKIHPGALAYARPFQNRGRQVEVFTGRILRGAGHNDGKVLGHVLAHEIGHVLEGLDRHASEGVMKPSWTSKDYALMSVQPLRLTAEDAALIHQGLARLVEWNQMAQAGN